MQIAGQVDKQAGEEVEVCFPAGHAHLFAKTEDELALQRLNPNARNATV